MDDQPPVEDPRPTPRHAEHAVSVLLEYLGVTPDKPLVGALVGAVIVRALTDISDALRRPVD